MKITLDTLIALVALIVAAVSLGTTIRFWRRSFRPIVTAAIRTHSAGNLLIAYNLTLLNSGTIPAKNIILIVDEPTLSSALGIDATPENKRRWLACFLKEATIPMLNSGDRISCAFGKTKENDSGFWKYNAEIDVLVQYDGWFGISYKHRQTLKVIDSNSFTGFMWG